VKESNIRIPHYNMMTIIGAKQQEESKKETQYFTASINDMSYIDVF
jgi:hypothetical protein